MSFSDTRWSVEVALENRGMNQREKYKLIRTLLINFDCEEDSTKFGFSDRIYFTLFKYKLSVLAMILGSPLLKSVKRNIGDWYDSRIVFNLGAEGEFADLNPSTPKVIFTLVPDHGNLGDLALGYAQKEFFLREFPDYEHVELTTSSTYVQLKSLLKKTNPDDIVVITGGGDMGTIYIGVERQRRFIVKKFAKNNIISFPQSIFFEESISGRRELRKSRKVYQSHHNLTLLARDAKSFDFMQANFPKVQSLLTPDIVLSLDLGYEPRSLMSKSKIKVLLAIRRDKESKLSKQALDDLKDYLVSQGCSVEYRDTTIPAQVISVGKERTKELNIMWAALRNSDLVITDRLHGMIFSVITGTPCIAVQNKDGKVGNLYKTWLSSYGSAVLADSISPKDIEKAIRVIGSNEPDRSDLVHVRSSFTTLNDVIAAIKRGSSNE